MSTLLYSSSLVTDQAMAYLGGCCWLTNYKCNTYSGEGDCIIFEIGTPTAAKKSGILFSASLTITYFEGCLNELL